MEADVKTALPRPTVGKALFYATREGRLSRKDPRQTEMQLREVNTAGPVAIRQYKD